MPFTSFETNYLRILNLREAKTLEHLWELFKCWSYIGVWPSIEFFAIFKIAKSTMNASTSRVGLALGIKIDISPCSVAWCFKKYFYVVAKKEAAYKCLPSLSEVEKNCCQWITRFAPRLETNEKGDNWPKGLHWDQIDKKMGWLNRSSNPYQWDYNEINIRSNPDYDNLKKKTHLDN